MAAHAEPYFIAVSGSPTLSVNATRSGAPADNNRAAFLIRRKPLEAMRLMAVFFGAANEPLIA